MDLLTGKGPSKRQELFYFGGAQLGAVRIDNFKFTFYAQPWGWPGALQPTFPDKGGRLRSLLFFTLQPHRPKTRHQKWPSETENRNDAPVARSGTRPNTTNGPYLRGFRRPSR